MRPPGLKKLPQLSPPPAIPDSPAAGQGVVDTLDVADNPCGVDHDGGSALQPDKVLGQFKLVIDLPFRIRKNGKRCLKLLAVLTGAFECVPQDDQDLGIFASEFLVEPPQLGDEGATLHSRVFAHKEEDDLLPG